MRGFAGRARGTCRKFPAHPADIRPRPSLAGLRLGRVAVSGWLGAAKLVLHPLAVWIAARAFGVDPFAAGVMVAAAALPVAGNVYILAQHFGLAEQRTSAAILISTAISIATIPLVMTLIGG